MKRLVVGIDGSASARSALRWAANTVGPDGELVAVTAMSPAPELHQVGRRSIGPPDPGTVQTTLERSWLAPVRELVGALEARVEPGTAHDALAAEALDRDADAIVVGTHAPVVGGPHRIGRTIHHLLRELPCPLVVVPRANRHQLAGGEPIIVGVGHGEATEAAVRWGAMVAEAHGLPLGLVRATGEGPVFQVDGALDVMALYLDPAKRVEWAAEDVAELARLAQHVTESEIEVAGSTVPGLPATRLAELSSGASLLVIGRHTTHIAAGHVTQPLRFELGHARCPVVVVPRAGDAGARSAPLETGRRV